MRPSEGCKAKSETKKIQGSTHSVKSSALTNFLCFPSADQTLENIVLLALSYVEDISKLISRNTLSQAKDLVVQLPLLLSQMKYNMLM